MTDRPDPDRLLSRIHHEEARSNRAKLKVFFGFAPGVGKTYAMLQSARRLRDDGVDVAIGYVETHGRADTAALADAIETLPRRRTDYRFTVLDDFDLEAALTRSPKVLLVDELPHTNAPGGRHAKRWQDVLDLLEAGIDVHTTFNVQHLESLNDVVAQITGVQVRETVPDSVLDRADEIELVDISIEELLTRMREGKIYGLEQAKRAADKFFTYGNLLALRELALRRVADRIDAEVRTYRETNAITDAWSTNERLLVAVGPAPGSARLVRATKRMATRLKATWVASYVELPAVKPLSDANRGRLETNLALAETLGAEIVRLTGARVSEALLDYARKHDVTRLIIGKPTHSRLKDLLRGSLLDEVVRGSGDRDVLVTSGEDENAPPVEPHSKIVAAGAPRWPGVVAGLVLVALATIVGHFGRALFNPADFVILYMLAVMLTAARFSRTASLTASLASVFAYDFFFVPPFLTLNFADARHLLTFTMLFVVGATISTLTIRIRRQEQDARTREERTAGLYVLTRELATADTRDEVARVVMSRLASAFHRKVAVLFPAGGDLQSASRDLTFGPQELAVARWTLDHGRPAGVGTDTLPGAQIVCIPMISDVPRGVIAMEVGAPLTTEQRSFVDVIARQAAVVVERHALADEARSAAIRARTEELRSDLLSTVSHDLRTPLAVITGAATTLRDAKGLTIEDHVSLYDSICDEATRMERLITNLLEMTRLETGVEVKRDWIPVEELVGSGAAQVDLRGRDLRVAIADDVPMVAVDAVLFPQAFVNLFENAVKYTPAGTPIDVSARVSDGRETVIVEVSDRGSGFAAADGEPSRLFDKFVRGDQKTVAGVGLGLAIVRGIVEAHGGELTAENRRGGGALFRLSIPLTGEPPAVPTDERPL
ncbi:MAG: sensor histidine kinase KdpD [Clostridia bacterium]|nr:sensor histidine kinase KdpD [Deltaproteobacteria bacterium]